MSRLKILHFPVYYPDPKYDRPFDLIFIAEHVYAASLHHDNVVLYISPLTSRSGKVEVEKIIEGSVHVIRIHTPRTKSEFLNRALVYFPVFIELLRLFAGGFYPQVIHVHVFANAKIPAALARVLRIPLIVTEHWSALCREGVLSHERLNFAKEVYEQSAMVLPVCNYLLNCIKINTGANFNSRLIFNTLDKKIFFDDRRERIKQILTVARLEFEKDIPTLLRAFALLKDKSITLKIVGRGDASLLVALSKELEVVERVEFLGEKPKSAIAELMRDSVVFALSSLWENSPCVIGEALCCGLPVVATNVGGVPELIEPGTGQLVPVGDVEALALALEEIMEHPQQFDRQDIAEKARARFSYEAIGAQLDEVYREVTRAS